MEYSLAAMDYSIATTEYLIAAPAGMFSVTFLRIAGRLENTSSTPGKLAADHRNQENVQKSTRKPAKTTKPATIDSEVTAINSDVIAS